MDKHKTAFVSHSHDSESYLDWIHELVNNLRIKGLDATSDRIESELRTINFPQMMVQLMKEKDFVILMITDKYSSKVDGFKGGAGYEGQMIMNLIQSNPNQLIICLKENNVPYFLKGYEYIDFRNEEDYEQNTDKIVNRAYEISKLSISELGSIPGKKIDSIQVDSNNSYPIKEEKTKELHETKDFEIQFKIPKSKPTDLDKNKFLIASFKEMNELFNNLFSKLEKEYKGFEYSIQFPNELSMKVICYLKGNKTTGLYMRVVNKFGSESIDLSYGHNSFSENSSNEMIYANEDSENNLVLSMTLGHHGVTPKPDNPFEIVTHIWENHLKSSIM